MKSHLIDRLGHLSQGMLRSAAELSAMGLEAERLAAELSSMPEPHRNGKTERLLVRAQNALKHVKVEDQTQFAPCPRCGRKEFRNAMSRAGHVTHCGRQFGKTRRRALPSPAVKK